MTTDSKQKTSRKLETREQQTRKKGWTPPSNLDAPEPPEGFHHRWVRFEYRGTQDDKNVVARIRSGYEPVKADEYPDRLGVFGLGRRIRKEFPHKFEAKSKPTQKVASAVRTTSSGRRTVRLTPSQVAIAKKLGVPLEEYAKHVKEA